MSVNGLTELRKSIEISHTLVAEKIEEWDSFKLFLEYNPDIKERYAVFKTYEILKNDR